MPEFFLGVVPLGIIAAGAALLWFVSWSRQQRGHGPAEPLQIVMWVIGVVMLLGGMYVVVGILANGFFVIVWIGLTIVFWRSALLYRRYAARSLIGILAMAAERDIPLQSVARSFADENGGGIASRAGRLADYLDAAVPLSLALQRSGLGFWPEVLLAADLGEKTGTLGPMLRKAIRQLEEVEKNTRPGTERLFYVVGVLMMEVLVVTFVMLKIVPVFQQMFQEFGLELPDVTQWLMSASRFSVNYWYLIIPVLLVFGWFPLFRLFSFGAVSRSRFSLMGRFFAARDGAMLMRMLSVGVVNQVPIATNLHLLAGYCSDRRFHRRLDHAARRVAQGAAWYDAMRESRLIGTAEKAVFQSAERANNLAWALDEMATRRARRVGQLANAIAAAMFPVLVLLLGIVVMFVAVGIMTPLFKLISGLA